MNIIELIQVIKFKDVKRAMKYYYPKTSKPTMVRYEEIMKDIGKYKSKEDKTWELRIDLVFAQKFWIKARREWEWVTEYGQEYYTTHAKNLKEKQTYAIEFTRWEISSQWKIAPDVLKKYKPCEILAHYLWEITFCGYTQKPIQKKMKYLHNVVKKIQSETLSIDKEKMKNFGK